MIFGYNNVFYDENSYYKIDDIHEKKYLEEIFYYLEKYFNEFENYDFYIYTQYYTGILPKSTFEKGNKVLFYLSEERNIPLPIELIKNFKFIFKSHLDKSIFNEIKNLFYLPLGYSGFIPKKDINNTERKYDIFFSGNLNNNRINLFNELQKDYYKNISSYINFTDGFSKGLPPNDYANMLNNSKIVLSPSGFITTDCFRTYEAMRQGCVVITDKLFNEDIFNKSPIIQIKNWDDLSDIVNYILNKKDFLFKLQKETINYYNENLSGYGVAKYIINIISNY